MADNTTNLTQFYDNLKQKLNNDSLPATPTMNIKMGPGGFNNSPNTMIWRNKAVKCCNDLKDDCHKHILLDIYCKILPLDADFINGNKNIMRQDINDMLASKGMSATQYMTSCYEATKAPLLDYIIRSVNGIGRSYMEEADEIIKDAQQSDQPVPEPTKPDVEDPTVNSNSQLIDVTDDTEYENFVDTLKKKTINKIVDDVSRIINNKKEEDDMTFDTTPIADTEEQLESTTSIAMNYIQQKLMKENIDLTPELQNELIGMAIRESTINQLDTVFRQPGSTFREFASRIRYGKGAIINESAVNYFKESVNR